MQEEERRKGDPIHFTTTLRGLDRPRQPTDRLTLQEIYIPFSESRFKNITWDGGGEAGIDTYHTHNSEPEEIIEGEDSMQAD